MSPKRSGSGEGMSRLGKGIGVAFLVVIASGALTSILLGMLADDLRRKGLLK